MLLIPKIMDLTLNLVISQFHPFFQPLQVLGVSRGIESASIVLATPKTMNLILLVICHFHTTCTPFPTPLGAIGMATGHGFTFNPFRQHENNGIDSKLGHFKVSIICNPSQPLEVLGVSNGNEIVSDPLRDSKNYRFEVNFNIL